MGRYFAVAIWSCWLGWAGVSPSKLSAVAPRAAERSTSIEANCQGWVGVNPLELSGVEPKTAEGPIQVRSKRGRTVSEADDRGVWDSLAYRGDVADFLKLLGVASKRNILASRQVKGTVNVNLFNVTFDETLQAVLGSNGWAYEEEGPFILVYTEQELAGIKKPVRELKTRVFQLNYIRAKDLAHVAGEILSSEGKLITPLEAGKASGESWAGGSYIVVRDHQAQLDELERLIDELDQRPVQVLIEATILAASLNDTNELGIDFTCLGGANFEAQSGVVGSVPATTTDLAGSTTVSAGTSFTANVTSGGLSIGLVKSNIGLFVNALESVTDVVILGNPKVLTLNRHEGKVIVGNRDGYITTQVTETTATQSVEFLETGTQLSFTPFVTNDGYIRMELSPKDSDGGVEVVGTFTLPSESTAEVTTNVLVKDGHTIVIGGLFRERSSIKRAQVPLMGNIPLLGALFRSTSDQSTREEVIFLVTPHIVKEDVDYAAGEEALHHSEQRLSGLSEGLQDHGRRHLAASHYQRALEHQAAGRTSMALWEATLACETSPSFADAIRLRDQLRGESRACGEHGAMRLFMRRLVGEDE